MSAPDFGRRGPWRGLFERAMTLTDHLATVIREPHWTFGGGTVLMLRLDHRESKDIDLFVPDPQYLGHVSPRLCDVAEALTTDYAEAADFIKLHLGAEGEIDIVVGTPLTEQPWEWQRVGGRNVRVETSAEILAKKMWHRGDAAKARDLFDLCAIAELEPSAIDAARPFLGRHAKVFLQRFEKHYDLAQAEFSAIRPRSYRRTFDECLVMASAVLMEV
jgi:predicted nucleotidyltransferase component of viral defense system